MFVSKFYICCQHFKIGIFYCANPDIYPFANGTFWPHQAAMPPGGNRLPLVGMHPFHQLPLSPAMSLHVPPDPRTQLPAQRLTLPRTQWNVISPTHLPPPAFPPLSWWQLHPGGKTLGLILGSLLSLELDFQLVSIPSQPFPANTSGSDLPLRTWLALPSSFTWIVGTAS